MFHGFHFDRQIGVLLRHANGLLDLYREGPTHLLKHMVNYINIVEGHQRCCNIVRIALFR
jgi:hypothetical protein